MEPLEIQKFLRTTPNGVEELKAKYAIDCKRHGKYPNLCLFRYNQIDSPFGEEIVRESRGIILNEADNWNVVAMGFTKFFNFGEVLADQIDWLTAEVQEKIDGSYIMLYWYDNHWEVATSGTPDASGQVGDFGPTFAELFWKTAKEQDLKVEWLGTDFCWVFELTTPFNRVVVDHKDCKIWSLSSRHIETLREMPPDFGFGKTCHAFIPERFPLSSVNACLKAVEAFNPLCHEGLVVVDKNKRRIKIKSPAYVMLHHAKDSLSKKRMCEVIRKGEFEEFKTAIETLPELKKIFDEINLSHETVRMTAEIYYNRAKHIENQKEFALRINDFDSGHFNSLLFQMRKTGQSAAQCLASPKMSIDHYMQLTGIK